MRRRKIVLQNILTKEEKDNLVEYMMEMVIIARLLSVADLKMKVVEICQQKVLSFKNEILGRT